MSVPAREFVASPRRATAAAPRLPYAIARRGASLFMVAALGFQLLGQAMPVVASQAPAAPAAAIGSGTLNSPATPHIAVALDDGTSGGGYVGFTSSTIDPNPQNLSALGATDWRIWGSTGNGTDGNVANAALSLAGDSGKSNGTAISALTDVEGPTPIPLRAIGPLGLAVNVGGGSVPFDFSWTGGAPNPTGTLVRAGLQHNAPDAGSVGYGFSFTVPTTPAQQRLTIWVSAHHGTGRLTASIGSAVVSDTGVSGGQNQGGIYSIDFSGSGSSGETMTVQYVLDSAVLPTTTLDSYGYQSTAANVAIYAAALSSPELIVNGGFEQPIAGSDFTEIVPGTGLTGWTINSGSIDMISTHWASFEGAQSVDLNGNAAGTISQTFATTPGAQYQLTFQYSANPDGPPDAKTASVLVNGTVIDSVSHPKGGYLTTTAPRTIAWTPASVIFTAPAATTTLTFQSTSSTSYGIVLDAVSVVPTGVSTLSPAAAPLLQTAASGSPGGIAGRLQAYAGLASQAVSLYLTPTCTGNVPSTIPMVLGTANVTLDASGAAAFAVNIDGLPAGQYVTATAIDATHTVSAFSTCIQVGASNDSWPNALDISASKGNWTSTGHTSDPGYLIDKSGQSRWYKFAVAPGAQVSLDLTGVPADYDVVLFKDITQAYTTLTKASDLNTLSANFAGQAFSGQAFSGQAFSAQAFSPDAYSAQAFSGQAFSADVFSGQAFSAQAFSGQAFSAQAFSGQAFSGQAFSAQAFSGQAFSAQAFSPQAFSSAQAYSPTNYSAQAFSGQAFSPQAFSGQAFSPQAFSSAQVQSVITVSANVGTAPESIRANTWNNTGNFYVRVSGKNGAFDPGNPFTLHVTQTSTSCGSVAPKGTAPGAATAAGIKTVILTDSSRIPAASDAERAALAAQLTALAGRSEVSGVVVDVATDTRIQQLNAQADSNRACPYAKNLVASALKDIVDSYRANNQGLAYVVLVGGDNVIPFFRYPDEALLAPEGGYIPPVLDSSASQASLQLNYVLSQDAYGAGIQINQNANTFPVPNLAVGRLVETAAEATTVLTAYLNGTTVGTGAVPRPTTSLVTGYDFLSDAATDVKSSLDAGIGIPGQSLIAPNNISPTDPSAWTAPQLKSALLGSRHDLVFLAGHFSANSALAADFSTTIQTTDLTSSPVNLANSIVFSAGCHSGYNIVNGDAVTGITQPLDWAEAFATKGATLIAGTGYQYGDTDFMMYSERIYSGFAAQLLAGTGPVAVGQALVQAKQTYLRDTPTLRGIDTKALLEATLFGLPMISVNMPNGRTSASGDPSVVTSLEPITSGAGQPVSAGGLGLQTATLNVSDPLTINHQQFRNPDATGSLGPIATWYSGTDGVTSKPFEPTLPLVSKNVTAPDQTPLRGVGFWGGTYTDTPGITPLTGAATTDLRGVHTSFSSPVFYPMKLVNANYFDALGGGSTRLLITPAQHRADGPGSPTSTLRLYSGMTFKLFYSGNVETRTVGGVQLTPALAAPPSILDVNATEGPVNSINVDTHVIGDPSAGIQEVWVTYTGFDNNWHSVDLRQDPNDSTHWNLASPILVPSGHSASEIRFLVQAVNGVGLVGINDNYGQDFSVTPTVVGTPNPTHVTLGGATTGTYGTVAQVTATLTGATPLVGSQPITVSLGGTTQLVTTDSSGVARANFQLSSAPGSYPLAATYGGDAINASSTHSSTFTINQVGTNIAFNNVSSAYIGAQSGVVATLTDANSVPVTQRTLYFVVSGGGGSWTTMALTDYLGRALVGAIPLPAGGYTITAYFNGSIPLLPSQAVISLSDATYVAASNFEAFSIQKYAQGISFNAISGATYGDPDFTVNPTASSGLPVLLSSGTPAVCTVASGFTVHIVAAGQCTLQATQPGNDTWAAALEADQSFTVAKRALSIAAISRTKILGATLSLGSVQGTDWMISAGGLVNGDQISGVAVTSAGAAASAGVGPYPINISATVSNFASYAITLVPGTLSVIYRFDGFLQPINDTGHSAICGTPCPVSIFKGGSTIPVKLQLKNASGLVVQAGALPIFLTPDRGASTTAAVDENLYTDPPTSGGTFALNGSQYQYNWSTKGWTIGYYWRIGVKLDDGQIYYVSIGLR
ncbi:MAG: choice-of-anchor C family protein [Chloroflexi bacterium]|nr:choice-of-anchor C family protein [Chloroflexota bacterium]